MILNQAQAEAVYGAMCAMNNVGGVISTIALNNGAIHVYEYMGGGVKVIEHDVAVEDYANQAGFAAAYGLQQG